MSDTVAIHGDCIEVMKGLSDGLVDLVLTSPPYRADKEYESWKSLQEYEVFADAWMEQAARILSPTGTMMLNVGYTKVGKNETLPLTYLYHRLAYTHGLKMVQEIVWRYFAGMAYKNRYTHRSERIMWLVKDPDNHTFNLDAVRVKEWFKDGVKLNECPPRCNPRGKNPTDVWDIKHVRYNTKNERVGQEDVKHPAVFPQEMVSRLIRGHSNEGDIVFDPFLGTGTTAVVAGLLGRACVGVELNDDYIPIIEAQGIPVEVHRQTLSNTIRHHEVSV